MRRLVISALLVPFLWMAVVKEEGVNRDKFRQLHTTLRSPNIYRAASGFPGHQYWQQRADYRMSIELDDENQRVFGEETITYHNNSPDQLHYLWLQLDQNMRAKDSDTYKTQTGEIKERMSFRQLKELQFLPDDRQFG